MMRVWEGYPHSRSAVSVDGIYRWVDHDGNTGAGLTGPCAASTDFIPEDQQADCDATYIKWLNKEGAYLYWLFERYHQDKLQVNGLGTIQNNFLDRAISRSRAHDLGHKETPKKDIYASVNEEYSTHLSSLPASPEVYMYEGKAGTGEDLWCKVRVFGKTHTIKKSTSCYAEYKLQLLLPESYVQTLV